MVPLVAEVGGDPPHDLRSNAFDRLIASHNRRFGKGAPPKFVKQIEDVLVVALSS